MSTSGYSLKNVRPTREVHRHVGKRFYDSAAGVTIIRLAAGEFFVTSKPDEMLVTVLGSCVATCLFDRATGLCGMNHFMLPSKEALADARSPLDCRYGTHAMEVLINEMLRAGARRERLEAKLFGGARLGIGNPNIGRINAQFAEDYLTREEIAVVARDLLGDAPRRVHLHPGSGKVRVKTMADQKALGISRHETAYRRSIDSDLESRSGAVELFDE